MNMNSTFCSSVYLDCIADSCANLPIFHLSQKAYLPTQHAGCGFCSSLETLHKAKCVLHMACLFSLLKTIETWTMPAFLPSALRKRVVPLMSGFLPSTLKNGMLQPDVSFSVLSFPKPQLEELMSGFLPWALKKLKYGVLCYDDCFPVLGF